LDGERPLLAVRPESTLSLQIAAALSCAGPSGDHLLVSGFVNLGRPSILDAMPSKPLDLQMEVAKAFVRDMRAFFAEMNAIRRDEIARGGRCRRSGNIRGRARSRSESST
jgi:hypothetical protein